MLLPSQDQSVMAQGGDREAPKELAPAGPQGALPGTTLQYGEKGWWTWDCGVMRMKLANWAMGYNKIFDFI